MRLRFCCALFLTAIPSFAAKRIQIDITDLKTNKVTSENIVIDSNRLRVDNGDNTVVMFLTAGGNRLVMLDKKKNEYQVIDQATMDQLGATMQSLAPQMQQLADAMKNMPPEQRAMMEKMMKGKMPGAAEPVAPLVFSAKGSGTANGFRCTNYDATRGAEKIESVCAAQASELRMNQGDFQVFEKMRDFTAGLLKAVASMPFAKSIPADLKPAGVDGFPVQTTTYNNGKADMRTDLKSVADVSVSDADFSTGNAKENKINIPAAPKQKGK